MLDNCEIMDRLENIDKLFRNELKDYASIPPPEVWGRIEQDLTKGRKKVLLPVFIRIAASIVFLAGISWFILKYAGISKQEHILSEAIQKQSSEKTVSTTMPSAEIVESSSSTVSSPAVIQDEPTIAVVTQITEPGEEILNSAFNEPDYLLAEIEALPQETTTADNTIIPIRTRIILPISEIDKNTDPIYKPLILTTSRNELIIQQNLLALEDQQAFNEKRGPSWSIGGHGGPQYTYRNVNVNTPVYPIDDYDQFESGVLAYSGGLHLEVEPAKRFSIQSGIYYSKIGQIKSSIQIDDQYSGIGTTWPNNLYTNESKMLPLDVVNSTGNITFDENLTPPIEEDRNIEWDEGVITAEQYFEFIEIPFLVKYLIIDRKIDVNICTGLWADFLVGNKATATDNENFKAEGKTENINSFNYCGSFSVGLGYSIVHNINISFEPFFKYYLSPINSNPETDVYPYSMGILTGITYLF